MKLMREWMETLKEATGLEPKAMEPERLGHMANLIGHGLAGETHRALFQHILHLYVTLEAMALLSDSQPEMERIWADLEEEVGG